MAWKPTAKMVWILGYLREHPGSTASQISDASPINEDLSAEYNERFPKGTISGAPFAIPVVYPALANSSLTRLLAQGLVRWEPTDNNHPQGYPRRWFVIDEDTDDDLEQAFAAPAAEREGG